jgi:hypothetical protein
MILTVVKGIRRIRFTSIALMLILVTGTASARAQGFAPESVEAWILLADQAKQRYRWTDDFNVRWPCPPLRVRKTDMVGSRNEIFQLLDNAAIYTVLRKQNSEKTIYTLSAYHNIRNRDFASKEWMLYETAEWDGSDYTTWNPGSSISFNGVRWMPRDLIEMPWRPRGRSGRLDQSFPSEAVLLLAEDANSQTYRITKGVNCPVDGQIVLLKNFRFLPSLIELETETDRTITNFDYTDLDITQYRYRIERARRTSPDSTWQILKGSEDFSIQIDGTVAREEFELEHYGIELVQSPNKFPNWIWLIVIGAILIGIAVWIRRRNA